MSRESAKRIYKELTNIKIQNGEVEKFKIDETSFDNGSDEPPKTEKDNNGEYFYIIGRVLPQSNIYNKSAFKMKIRIPFEFPFKPPAVQMLTKIYHPNIGPEGKICMGLLRTVDSWQPTNTLNDVINGILKYIDSPNINEAYSKDIADEYLQRRAEFDRKALECVNQNIVPRT